MQKSRAFWEGVMAKKQKSASLKVAQKTGKTTKKQAADKKHAYSVEEILKHVRPTPMIDTNHSDDEKIKIISEKFREIMETLGLDLDDDSLKDTPKRVAKMYVKEIFSGLNPDFFPKITVIENKMHYDQMICVDNIQCLSFCEHHFLTIDGLATVAYVPNKKVIGLSKINRIVQFFSRRPQVQERLTKQIADCLQYVLETEHVAVHINAKHYCVITRGVEDAHSSTSTTDLRGDFKTDDSTRKEFLSYIKNLR